MLAQDDQLIKWVNKFGTYNSWKSISKKIPGKSEIKCNTRWLELQKLGNLINGPWSKEEDEVVRQWVQKYGPTQWTELSSQLLGRLGKQCRERWFNHLDPNISKAKWTLDEDIELVRNYLLCEADDKKWTKIRE